MMNGKTPLYLTLLGAALLAATMFLAQPYSADFPGTDYAAPARRYLRAAMRQDSGDLNAMAASPAAVQWALQTARTHPESLAAWTGRTYTYITARRGDTAEVLVYPTVEPCSEVPIVMRLVGSRDHARVLEAQSECLPVRSSVR